MATTYQDLFKKGYTAIKPKTGNYATLKTPQGAEFYKPITLTGYSNVSVNPNQKGATKGGITGQVNTDVQEMNRLKSLQPINIPENIQTPTTPTVGGFDFGNYSTSLTNYLNAIKPQTPEERIKQQQTYYELLKQQYDPQVAATTAVYGDILARQQEASKGAIGQTRAMANAAGLAGTPMGQAQMQKTAERQAQIEKAIDMEKGVKIQQILGEAQIISQKMAEADVLAKMNYADKALAIQKEATTQAKQNLFDLAKTGYGWDDKTKTLAEQAGYTGDLAEVLYKASMPTEGAIDWKTVNVGDGRVLFYGVNPQTGQLEQKTTDVNVPQGYKTTFANGQMYYVPEKNEEGDLTGAIKYESESDKKFRQSKELEYLKSSLNISEAEAKKKLEGTTGIVDTKQAKDQISRTLTAIKNAEKMSQFAGKPSWWTKTWRDLTGSEELTDLIAQSNAIRSNILTLKTDPNIKKFFGPQMSNADVQMMMSSGTVLDPELQSPKMFKEELDNLKKALNVMNEANANEQTESNQQSSAYQVGQIYEDANGNKAKWIGNGWQKI